MDSEAQNAETQDSIKPGTVEIDRSDAGVLVKIGHPDGPFTVSQLRLYASYLATVADEAAAAPEPEVDELVAVFDATEARWLEYKDAARVMARAVLDAGYERASAGSGSVPTAAPAQAPRDPT